MKKNIVILFFFLLQGCDKIRPEVNDVIFGLRLSQTKAFADGEGKTVVSVKLNSHSDPEKRNVVFKTSSGNFVKGEDGKITVKAEFEADSLIAKAILPNPFSQGTVTITAKPDLPDPEIYLLKDSIVFEKSVAEKISLQTNSYAIRTNFQSEDTIKGILMNEFGKGVSNGTKVHFDAFLNDNVTDNVMFRNSSNSSINSQVSTYFSVNGSIPIDSKILIMCTVLENGLSSNKKDTLEIFIIK